MNSDSRREFEKWYERRYWGEHMDAKEREDVFSKLEDGDYLWDEMQDRYDIWQACERRMLLSRVSLPERMDAIEAQHGSGYYAGKCEGFNDALDSIKLVPVSLEMPSEREFSDWINDYIKNKDHGYAQIACDVFHWLKTYIAERRGG